MVHLIIFDEQQTLADKIRPAVVMRFVRFMAYMLNSITGHNRIQQIRGINRFDN
ncbi:Uncharacterised protein [Vibrio cholerae]|nr:Uncharacterised protein [Vibrio cholerae]